MCMCPVCRIMYTLYVLSLGKFVGVTIFHAVAFTTKVHALIVIYVI